MKILILSASPQRDIYIDKLLQKKLQDKGHDVWIRRCLRDGRTSVLEVQPDVVVVAPIRNVYSRDFAENCKRFGLGVVTRHTEPSCDKADWERMDDNQKNEIMGKVPYVVDSELLWGEYEAEQLNSRKGGFKSYAVGSFVADIYKSDFIREQLIPKEVLCEKHKLDANKQILLVSSPWGFVDSCPDLTTDHTRDVLNDETGTTAYIELVKKLKSSLDINILLTLHPGVETERYRKELQGIPIDTETPAMDLLVNSDCLIHGGSTMAIEMHWLNKPAYQFSDVNGCGWWQDGEAVISKVSPRMKSEDELIASLKEVLQKSNANEGTIKILEEGRYGNMDGNAVDRAVEIIEKANGKFKLFWPTTGRNYSQLFVRKWNDMVRDAVCSICKEEFAIVTPIFLNAICQRFKVKPKELMGVTCCPNCGARFFMEER